MVPFVSQPCISAQNILSKLKKVLVDGQNWSHQQLVQNVGGTSTSPSLGAFNRKLYMAWKGEGDDQRIFYSAFDGQNWSHQQLINGVEGTSAAPSLAGVWHYTGGKLYMAWKGEGDRSLENTSNWSLIWSIISSSSPLENCDIMYA